MNCCHCQAAADLFDPRVATHELKQYRQRGPRRTTRLLLAALSESGVTGRTLLDIGGGIGVLQHELLQMGVAQASAVEASPAYLASARAEAERQGHADRITSHQGDFVALAPTLLPADIVTLDRVICCYPDMPALVTAAADHTRWRCGVVVPHDTWWIRTGIWLINRLFWLRRSSFRAFAHPLDAMEALLVERGLQPRSSARTLIWSVRVYERAAAPSA